MINFSYTKVTGFEQVIDFMCDMLGQKSDTIYVKNSHDIKLNQIISGYAGASNVKILGKHDLEMLKISRILSDSDFFNVINVNVIIEAPIDWWRIFNNSTLYGRYKYITISPTIMEKRIICLNYDAIEEIYTRTRKRIGVDSNWYYFHKWCEEQLPYFIECMKETPKMYDVSVNFGG